MEDRDESTGLGASDQADGGSSEPKGEPTETAEAPKVDEANTEGD